MPHLIENYYLNFYGGEPLLSFELIKQTISFLNNANKESGKKSDYSITTNGSLLSYEIIQFIDEHKFSVELSFDGLTQDKSRQKGSVERIVPIIQELLECPNIDLETNSVFSPDTVSYLSESIKFIMELGVSDIRFSISTTTPWNQASLMKLENELAKLGVILLAHYKRYGNIPVANYTDAHEKGIFHCTAGKDRVAIAADGGVWGCFLFADYFRERENSLEYQDYYYGNLEDFMKNHEEIYPQISSNYAQLSMDNFRTSKGECFLCKEFKNCAVCPINAAISGAPIGQIPAHLCEIQKIRRREKEKFSEDIQKLANL